MDSRLSREDINTQICDDGSQKEEEENDVDTLIAMWIVLSCVISFSIDL